MTPPSLFVSLSLPAGVDRQFPRSLLPQSALRGRSGGGLLNARGGLPDTVVSTLMW